MKNQRPVFLNLLKIKFPIMAIVSIAHRLSGFVLFFGIPAFLWAISTSLDSEEGFIRIKAALFQNLSVKIFTFVMLSALVYHLLAGIRHLFMDWGWFESLREAKITSFLVIFLSIVFVALLGKMLWL
jgi:succinate dehydrogenase / fumarate reductase cytochrome b subunit